MTKTKSLILALVVAFGACGGGGAPKSVNSTDDYKKAASYMMDKAFALMTGDDCAKIASDLKSFEADNKALIDSAEAWKKDHPEDDKAMQAELASSMKDKLGGAMGTMMKCGADPTFKEAMKDLKSH
jgi:hypothetical protein|nr:hypothetical protein [Kofleriaceae bacterium]